MVIDNDLIENRVLAIIPARSGSKGIIGKNMINIMGKPLIQYSIESILDSKLISKSIVSTDSKEIGEFCTSKGIDFPFLRPKKFSNDKAKSIDVVLHALNELEKHNEQFDYVLLVQPTTPFRSDGIIDKAINQIIKSGSNSLISVKPVDHKYHPNWQFKLNSKEKTISSYETKVATRRQNLKETFIRDGSIYITKTGFLRKKSTFFDFKTEFIIDSLSPNINIDTHNDLELARDYAKRIYISNRTS